jgi:hypothetical protein
MILDELRKNDAKWEQRMADLDTKWDHKFSKVSDKVEGCMSKLKKVVMA